MAFLKNLQVKKVSFVRRGANRRKFLLLKSEEDIINSSDQQKHKEELMQNLVKTKVMKILKSEQDPAKVIELLKTDDEIVNLELRDEEFDEVRNSVEFFKALNPFEQKKLDAENKKKREAEAMKKEETDKMKTGGDQLSDVVKQLSTMTKAMEVSNEQNKALSEKLAKQEKVIVRRDIVKWLTINCPYLPADIQKTADEILTLQDTSESAAKLMKDSLQRTSAALENSNSFDEVGNGNDGQIGPRIPGSELLREIKKQLTEVKKGGEKVNEPEIIRSIVAEGGRNNYMAYRNQVIQRSKLAGIDPSVLQNLI